MATLYRSHFTRPQTPATRRAIAETFGVPAVAMRPTQAARAAAAVALLALTDGSSGVSPADLTRGATPATLGALADALLAADE